ncbi:MAG TPA: methyltransferase domain-containing protein [Candidatus Eisenbacteria bacterium]|nr:methyltransferase domain-containing protein [Candidatus Eisenbacteria bacterium]
MAAQARLIDPITRAFFQEAGLAGGMRVLDVGSGAGDVAFLAAELVGSAGEVVGVDRSPVALASARERAAARSLRNVSFHEGDPTAMTFERPFDAVVGRYVLQFQQDPAGMLRRLAAHLRPGGTIVFHELDWDGVRSAPPAPTYDRCCRWIGEVIRASGADNSMGAKLGSVFVAAGLQVPTMRLQAVLGSGVNCADAVQLAASVARTLLPAMEQFGVATAAEVGVDTLAERMVAEAVANGSAIIARSEIGAWSRV